MWAMVMFLMAFAFTFFLNTSLVTRLLAGITLAVVVGFITWCVVDSWEEGWWRQALWKRATDIGQGAEEAITAGISQFPQLHRTHSSLPQTLDSRRSRLSV